MTKLKALITGVNGFVGPYLAEELINQGMEVYGTVRPHSTKAKIDNLDKIKLFYGDLQEYSFVKKVIKEVEPDYIFHLAAQSFVGSSFDAAAYTLSNNIVPALNILEVVKDLPEKPIIQFACSSEEYGLVKPEETPITESQPFRPLSPYGVSKITQEMLGYQYHHSYGIPVIITRAFNHEGPGRGRDFVTSSFAEQIAKIEAYKQDPIISHGNLDSVRDFTDVRDMVHAYFLAVTGDTLPSEPYNICSGRGITIKAMLDILIGLSTRRDEIVTKQDPSRMRPSDVELLIGDNTKFIKATRWYPHIPIEKTLLDLLNYWRDYHGVLAGKE